MLCQNCHKEEAVVKFTQVINNQKKEINLCKNCAELKGFHNPLVNISKVFEGLLLEIFGKALPEQTTTKDSSVKCPQCGMTMADFKKRRLLGCDRCYDTFHEELKVMLRRIHGSNVHIGKHPLQVRPRRRVCSLAKLQRELSLAIQREEYEKAAELRDLIKEIKKSPLKESNSQS